MLDSMLRACRKPRDVSASYKVDAAQPLGRAPTPEERRPVDTQSPTKGTAPAVMKALDGNEATANIAYAMSDVCFIYPITPSTPMGESADAWAAEGRKNLHGNVMQVGGLQPCRAVRHPAHPASAAARFVEQKWGKCGGA